MFLINANGSKTASKNTFSIVSKMLTAFTSTISQVPALLSSSSAFQHMESTLQAMLVPTQFG